MRYITVVIMLMALISCGAVSTVYDYDEYQDFSIYKTYNFYPEMDTELNELNLKRLLKVTEAIMLNKGFIKSETPDIYINFKAVINQLPSQSTIGLGVGSGGRDVSIGVGGSIPIGRPETFLELTIDFVDVNKSELVWQAITEKRFHPNASPNTHTNFFKKIIEKTLIKYPPKKD